MHGKFTSGTGAVKKGAVTVTLYGAALDALSLLIYYLWLQPTVADSNSWDLASPVAAGVSAARSLCELEMDDELEKFIREHKARVAEDKASLEQDPPYMEMRTNVRRAYDSAIKENIPPSCRATVPGKEEVFCVGLPLGVDYAKKKHRLQQELRMDYRRHMAEKNRLDTRQLRASEGRSAKDHVVPHPPSPPQGPAGAASSRDAATLTEVRKTKRGANRLLRRRTSHREASDEEPLDRESGDDDGGGGGGGGEERVEPVEGRRQQRHMGVQAAFGSSSSYRANGEKRENPAGGARADRRHRLLTNRDQTEFATGLLIGAADAEGALRKRQERYRHELEEQIAEQQRRRRREKELELRVAATGGMDPEKQPDHIQYIGLNRRREGPATEPHTGRPSREYPPPEPVHVAFQSPLLEYSAALGDGLLSPYSQHGPPPLHRVLDMPRIPAYLPHPPSAIPESVYRSPCHEACHYYSTRTTLDPRHHLPYSGQQLPGTSGGFPGSCWAVPPGGTIPQLGHHSPHSQYIGSHVPDPHPPPPAAAAAATRSPMRTGGGAVSVDSAAGAFPGDRARTTKEKMLSYKEALKQQILERQEQRRAEQEERERYEARLEADMRNHQPWGRGGGGAPLRDSTGNLLTDLHQMHKLNEEAYTNPEQRNRRAPVTIAVHRADQPIVSDRVSGFAHVQTPQFARGSVFASEPSAQQLHEQDKYKGYLKEQIEEKRRQKAEEREQSRLEEEREEQRLAEQRVRIQKEYEEEQDRRKRKEMEQKAKNEELVRLGEERKKEAERAKREEEEKENAELRQQYERERQARLEEVHREPSPPIPALQRRQGPPRYTPRPPTVDSQRSIAPMSERSLSGLQSPPVPACRNHLRATEDQRDVFSELSALRRQLRSEQRRLEVGLLQGEWEELESPLNDRLRERPPADVFDMARLRLQAAVRRPRSRKPSNLHHIHDSLQLRASDGEFRPFSSEFPRIGDEEGGVASRRRRGYRDHHMSSSQQTGQGATIKNLFVKSVASRPASLPFNI
ncbi:Centrosome and spindle pole-associated protein 1 [Merluccius polli]|uniref:Centrosome and spindle pole-associated protein 1 n=1 Tax=Merluccius polli TaxID=89951 RepID=A0AA47N5F0_MERPO|nr:Centrosome and spindle pole-associated protein 1 [Merluccius polli]